MLSLAHARHRASSLLEAAFAASMAALFLGSLFTMNTSTMSTIKMAKEAAWASQILQERVESMRIANWHQVTDADWILANLINTDTQGSSGLKNLSETLTLVPYGSAATATTQLTRSNGSTHIVTENPSLLTENAMKVIWAVSFTGAPNDRATTRQTVTILAKGGVAK
jgi:hypothetical protein